MSRMLLSSKRLGSALKAQRFELYRSCTVTKEIGFSRPSSIPRLYEQLRVYGQGKRGDAVYATTAVSVSPSWIHDDCISIEDLGLMFALESDAERHWTLLADANDAKRWEKKLTELADAACRDTTEKHGDSLAARLRSDFELLDRYIDQIGDMRAILDAEYRFVENADDHERALVDQWSIGKGDDWRLACHVSIRYGNEFIPAATAIFRSKLHESTQLRTLLYLLADQVAACRTRYATTSLPHKAKPGGEPEHPKTRVLKS